MQRELTPIIDRVRPDVMVRETAELAAAPMAAARGIPLVTVAFSGVLPERARALVLDALGPLWHAEGLGEPSWDDIYGQLYLHPFPVSFGQRPDSAVVRPIRRDRGAPNADPPPWVATLGTERPFVYVTSGTEPTVAHVSRGVSCSPHWATWTWTQSPPSVHTSTRSGLGAVPTNVRVERFVPQADLLARASAVVSHGGAGTVLGAAAHGLPQVVVPLFADQWENGCRRDRRRLRHRPRTRPVQRSTTSTRRFARCWPARHTETPPHACATEIEAMPTADDLAVEIEALAGG